MRLLLLLAIVVSAPALAKVAEHEAQHLRSRLTPLGAERAGNADGTIPPWTGGLTAAPPCWRAGARYCDPYGDDRPIAEITAENIEDWADHLSEGQLEMLRNHAGYRIPVYPTRRSLAHPGAVYEAAQRNAVQAVLAPSGDAVREASVAVPFPIPKDGVEPVWNHRLRYRGPGYSRWFSQATVTSSGAVDLIRLREDADFPYARGAVGEDGIAQQWLQVLLEPARLHGYISVIFDSLDAEAAPLTAWRQVPGQRSLRRQRSYGGDNPAMLAEDLRFDDQIDMFQGSPDRYLWRIAGKRDMVVPYNAYRVHDARDSLRDVLRPVHLDPAYLRYELHRVWVVEANLKPSASHRYKRRTFYIDEDSWQILMVDLYDRGDRLWRWQEAHTLMAYDRGVLVPVVEVYHDLPSARYLVTGIDSGDPEWTEKAFDPNHFAPGQARAQVPRRAAP